MRIQNNINSASGFSLIEVLVSILIVSIGLLGVAGLFSSGIKSTDSAYVRSQAVLLAYGLADRIRANPAVLASYALAADTTLSAPANNCASQTCSSTQLAAADLYDWKTGITELPGGVAEVVIVDPGATITICWEFIDDPDENCFDNPDSESFIMAMSL